VVATSYTKGFFRAHDASHSGTVSFRRFVEGYIRMQLFHALRRLPCSPTDAAGDRACVTPTEFAQLLAPLLGARVAREEVECAVVTMGLRAPRWDSPQPGKKGDSAQSARRAAGRAEGGQGGRAVQTGRRAVLEPTPGEAFQTRAFSLKELWVYYVHLEAMLEERRVEEEAEEKQVLQEEAKEAHKGRETQAVNTP